MEIEEMHVYGNVYSSNVGGGEFMNAEPLTTLDRFFASLEPAEKELLLDYIKPGGNYESLSEKFDSLVKPIKSEN